jgi:thiol-disulfide isomerase/thioredoxin
MPGGVGVLITAMTFGLAVLLAALVLAVAGGTAWRLTNGRMRSPRVQAGSGSSVPLSPRVLQQVGVLADASTAGSTDTAPGPGVRLTSDQLGRPLGDRATLVQFSSAFCAPCRATRRILADVAGLTQGVAHIEIDAESRLDLVRELNVLRTPTVLVLAGDGRIVRRASGQPRKPDVIAAIGVAAGI